MDTMMAFALGELNRGKEMKVFDWDKAAKLIAEYKPDIAEAGLYEDWGYTSGVIYENCEPIYDSYTFLASTLATPILKMDGESFDCYIMESQTNYTSETKWSKSALEILKRGGE